MNVCKCVCVCVCVCVCLAHTHVTVSLTAHDAIAEISQCRNHGRVRCTDGKVVVLNEAPARVYRRTHALEIVEGLLQPAMHCILQQ
jgi:hypothetical protein